MGYICELTDSLIKSIKENTALELDDNDYKYISIESDGNICRYVWLPIGYQTINMISMLDEIKKYYPKKPKTIWDLKEDDIFYVIDDNGHISKIRLDKSNYCLENAINMGNAFLTFEEAAIERDRRLAEQRVLKRISELNDGWNPDWGDVMQAKIELHYSIENDEVMYFITHAYTNQLDKYYIKDEELAKRLIVEMEKDIRKMLGVEENE